MLHYSDEDMDQRRYFVSNIPYFRGMNTTSLTKVVFQMKEKSYDGADFILKHGDKNNKIMILWEGSI